MSEKEESLDAQIAEVLIAYASHEKGLYMLEAVNRIKALIQKREREHGKEAFEAGHDCIPYWTYEEWLSKEQEWFKN